MSRRRRPLTGAEMISIEWLGSDEARLLRSSRERVIVARTAPVVQALLSVFEQYGVEDVIVWPHMAGSAPMYLYTREPLNLPLVSSGLGHGAGAHSPDEYLVIEGNDKVAGLVRAEQSYVDILYAYAEWPE